MRLIKTTDITNVIEDMLIDACENIPNDVLNIIQQAKTKEQSPIGKMVLNKIIENDDYATNYHLPICQDTGIVVCFLEIGYDVHIDGDIYEAINEGVRKAYQKGYFRKSVVRHPIDRINTTDNTPAITHIKLVSGDKLKITLTCKGAGSENMSAVKMLTPADGIEGIKKFVIDTVIKAGGKPCPPIIVGLGIGGDFELSTILAKKALLRELNDENPDPILNKLEKELLVEINNQGIGPMGFGGTTTCLSVKANSYPCHIASLPVAVNIQCHASRHKTKTL